MLKPRDLLVASAAEAYDRGERCDMEAGMAKFFASEAAVRQRDGGAPVLLPTGVAMPPMLLAQATERPASTSGSAGPPAAGCLVVVGAFGMATALEATGVNRRFRSRFST